MKNTISLATYKAASTRITAPMRAALVHAHGNLIFNGPQWGRAWSIHTLRALVKRGLMELVPDRGNATCFRITDAGRAALEKT